MVCCDSAVSFLWCHFGAHWCAFTIIPHLLFLLLPSANVLQYIAILQCSVLPHKYKSVMPANLGRILQKIPDFFWEELWWDAGITFGCPTAWTRGTHWHIAEFWHFCSQKVVYRKYFFCTFFFIWKKLSFGFEGFPHSPSFDFYFRHRAQCKLYFCSAAPTILTFFAHTNTQNIFF